MNKEQLLELLNKLNLDKKHYCILSGGSLVLHNLKKKTGDLDLFVTQELFNKLKLEYELKDKDPEHVIYKYPLFNIIKYDVDIYLMDSTKIKISYVDGYPVEDLEEILEFKLSRNLDKDQEDIKNIKDYLNKNR
jgi:hypothetical protein